MAKKQQARLFTELDDVIWHLLLFARKRVVCPPFESKVFSSKAKCLRFKNDGLICFQAVKL